VLLANTPLPAGTTFRKSKYTARLVALTASLEQVITSDHIPNIEPCVLAAILTETLVVLKL
jgi:hypothetical protein